MKIKESLLSIILLFGLIVSCDTDTKYLPELGDDYFPLGVGDIWEYENQTRKVIGTESINGKEYKRVEVKYYRADTIYSTHEMYYRKKNGIKIYKVNHEKTGEFLFADFSREDGESWTYPANIGDDDNWNVTVRTDIDFDFGDLVLKNCKSFYYDVPNWADEEHVIIFAPGIGEISNVSLGWGLGDTLRKATINGIQYQFK
jgi:hypothetical protein